MRPQTAIHHDILTLFTALAAIMNQPRTFHMHWQIAARNLTIQYNPHTHQMNIAVHNTPTHH